LENRSRKGKHIRTYISVASFNLDYKIAEIKRDDGSKGRKGKERKIKMCGEEGRKKGWKEEKERKEGRKEPRCGKDRILRK